MLFTNLLLATLATLSAAEVALESSPSVGVFSFTEWIEGIIQNPDGDNLTPEEAYAAWELSINQTEPSGRKPLQRADSPLLPPNQHSQSDTYTKKVQPKTAWRNEKRFATIYTVVKPR